MPAFERRRWDLRSGAAYAVQVLREEGARGLADRVLSYAGVHRAWVIERRLTEPLATAARTAPVADDGLAFGEAGLPDLHALAELRGAEHDQVVERMGRVREPVEALHRRLLAHGDRCFVAREGARVAAALWASRGAQSVPYLWCDLALAADEAYVYDMFVAPEMRGRALARRVHLYAAARLAEAGCVRSVGLIRVYNVPALRTAAHAGYQPIGMLTCVGVRGRALHLGDALPIRAWPSG
jgi:GNAT superfamily N-acetyltransferase